MSYDYILILTTTATENEGKKIATILVEEKKAACVSIIPKVSSLFFWEGEIRSCDEVQLLIKTKRAFLNDVISLIKSNHSYEVPEIIALPIFTGYKEYLNWIDESLQDIG